MKRGKIFVISGPSGVGKGTVIDLAKPKLKNFGQIVTITTREERINGRKEKDRKFISVRKFKEMIRNNEFIEYNFYDENYYGTPKKDVENILNQGKNVLLEIDINGAKNIKKQYLNNAILIFIYANLQDIEKRIRKRGQNTEKEIKERLKIAKSELKEKEFYDYEIINEEGKQKFASQKLVKICNQ